LRKTDNILDRSTETTPPKKQAGKSYQIGNKANIYHSESDVDKFFGVRNTAKKTLKFCYP
jgi:hypothetical protein